MDGIGIAHLIWAGATWILIALVVVELWAIIALLGKLYDQGEKRL